MYRFVCGWRCLEKISVFLTDRDAKSVNFVSLGIVSCILLFT